MIFWDHSAWELLGHFLTVSGKTYNKIRGFLETKEERLLLSRHNHIFLSGVVIFG